MPQVRLNGPCPPPPTIPPPTPTVLLAPPTVPTPASSAALYKAWLITPAPTSIARVFGGGRGREEQEDGRKVGWYEVVLREDVRRTREPAPDERPT